MIVLDTKQIGKALVISLGFFLSPSSVSAADFSPVDVGKLSCLDSSVISCSNRETPEHRSIIADNSKPATGEKGQPLEDESPLPEGETEIEARQQDDCWTQIGEKTELFVSSETGGESETRESETEKPVSYVPQPTPEELAIYQKIAQADSHYLCGETFLAEQIYKQVKEPFPAEISLDRQLIPEPIHEAAQLPPGGTVYWRLYHQGLEDGRFESKILAPLKLLTEQYPEFIPGHLHYTQALQEKGYPEQAREVLNKAVEMYPNQAPLVRAKIEADEAEENWLEASLTARRFALFNRDHFRAPEFIQLAEKNLQRYQNDLSEQMTWNAVGSGILGGLGYALLGNLNGPLSAIETSVLLMEGEANLGTRLCAELKNRLPLLEDPEVLAYVGEVGQKMAAAAGRDEFNYEFYVVVDDSINAFALPGGKIFVNTGAILNTHSEAELAGLLAHEISHAALSHGFQLMTQGNLTVNVAQFIPYVGSDTANLIVLNYSRDMERQADLFGSRLLAATGYAADGVRGLMVVLDSQSNPSPPAWLSTHPDTSERVQYIEQSLVQEGLNRYAYEGVVRHWQIRTRLGQILDEQRN